MLLDDNFAMQGGVRNYLGKTEEVTAPKYWQSSKNSPPTELAYITEAEKGLLADANLHGSLKNGKPNVGASGLLSYDGFGSTDPGQNRSGGDVSNDMDRGRDDGNDRMGASSGSSNFVGDIQGSTYDEAGTGVTDVDAEDEYLEPDNDHFKATQKAIKQTNEELRELGLDKSDYTDWTDEEKDTYQKEMNKLKGTEGVNYSFYKGNEGTTNLSFQEHFKDVEATNPTLAKIPTMRFLIAAGRTLKENLTTDYGTGKYGGVEGSGSSQAVDQGGWIGRVFNSDGTVNENLTDNEINDLYNQAQAELPFIIGNTDPQESMVNKFFNNMGNNLGVSSAYLDTYNAAKDKISQSLNLQPITSQFGFGNTFNQNFDRSMTSANPFFEELTNQGLI
tara:strand:- start:199 stop:1368 length:1170 start_codon:yes stop_codon:yes gene_type:complete